MARAPRRSLFDLVAAATAIMAVGALGYVGCAAWLSGQTAGPPVLAAMQVPPAAVWTDADEKACIARARAAASSPDTGTYMITNASIAEGAAGLGTKTECELTAKPTRFCGAQGTAQLVAIVNDYITRMDLVRLGLAAQGAPMAIAGGMFGGEAAAGDAIYSDMKADTVAYLKTYDVRIATAMRALAAGGIVKADDFKPFPFAAVPKRIEDIFAGVTPTRQLCG